MEKSRMSKIKKIAWAMALIVIAASFLFTEEALAAGAAVSGYVRTSKGTGVANIAVQYKWTYYNGSSGWVTFAYSRSGDGWYGGSFSVPLYYSSYFQMWYDTQVEIRAVGASGGTDFNVSYYGGSPSVGCNFTVATYTISGSVYDISNNVADTYTIDDLMPGTYPIYVNTGADPATYPFLVKNVTVGPSQSNVNFYCFGGYIVRDNLGIVGVEVYVNSKLWGTTNGSPYYAVGYVPAGSYTVKAQATGWTFYPATTQTVTISDSSISTLNFATYDIFGYVKRYGTGVGINGLQVRISGGTPAINTTVTTQNDSSSNPGYYYKFFIGPGTYTVEVLP